MRNMYVLRVLGGCLVVSGLAFSSPLLAEKWYFEPVASARLGYDDNVRLTTANTESAFSGGVSVSAPFGVRTEVSDVKMEAKLDSRRYEGLSDLDSDDLGFIFDATRRFELDRLRLRGGIERDSTRVSELGTTGRIQSSTPRLRTNINPSWARQVTERTSFGLGYEYTDVNYDDDVLFGLFDYEYQTVDAEIIHELSERNRLLGILMAAKFEAPDAGTEQKSYWARVGFERDYSETFKARVLVGLARTESDYLDGLGMPASSDDNDVLLEASVEKSYETFSVRGSVSASEVPTGSGRLLRQNAIGLNLEHEFSPRTQFLFEAQWYRNKSAGGINDGDDKRRYYSLVPRVAWRATRWWTIEGGYRYRSQEYTESGNGAADSNAVFLTARYRWPMESLAR